MTHFVVSNRAVTKGYISRVWLIAEDTNGGLTAYGIYDSHNAYIGVYRVEVMREVFAEILSNLDKTCGSAEEP